MNGIIGMSIARAEAAIDESAPSVFALDSGYWIVLIIAALIVALIVVIMMRAQLKTAKLNNAAESYVRDGSFKLSIKRDQFLYETVSRRKIEKPDENAGKSEETK